MQEKQTQIQLICNWEERQEINFRGEAISYLFEQASKLINDTARTGQGSFIIISPEFANRFNELMNENARRTQEVL
jgi:hypothetical protein